MDKKKMMEDLKVELFKTGGPNDAYARYFTGQSYLHMLLTSDVSVGNVTFEPGCRNHWHIHHGKGQVLLVTGGRGWYQEWGKPARELKAGDVVAKDSWFAHLAIEVANVSCSNEWCEEVVDDQYDLLP